MNNLEDSRIEVIKDIYNKITKYGMHELITSIKVIEDYTVETWICFGKEYNFISKQDQFEDMVMV